LPLAAGGIFSIGSVCRIRFTSSLSAGLPGTTATAPDSSFAENPSFTSSRSPACRCFSSKPWHLKQLLERIGRISRLKSIFLSSLRAEVAAAARTNTAAAKVGRRRVNKRMGGAWK
jgi:hypothetical protein